MAVAAAGLAVGLAASLLVLGIVRRRVRGAVLVRQNWLCHGPSGNAVLWRTVPLSPYPTVGLAASG